MKYLVIFVLLAGLVLLRAWYLTERDTQQFLQDNVNKEVTFTAQVVVDPDVRSGAQYVVVQRVSGNESAGYEKIRITLNPSYNISYGDRFEVQGNLQLPENFETDTGREFDYVKYLAAKDIAYVIYKPRVTNVSNGHGRTIVGGLLWLKHKFISALTNALPHAHARLASGMLIGEKNALSKEEQQQFRNAGLIHVVVLSGYNVTIIVEAMLNVLRFLPLSAARAAGAVGIVLFAILTGGGATVIRASIMALLAVYAAHSGRTYNVLRALFLACALMVLHNPSILLHDPSFQLSAMATFALVTWTPWFEKRLWFITEKFGLRASIASTLATQLFLTPLLLYFSGVVSPISLLSNIAILAVVPAAMLFSFCAAVCGMVWPFIGTVVGLLAYALLSYIFAVVDVAIAIPYAFISIPPLNANFVIAFYVLCALGFLLHVYKTNRAATASVAARFEET